MGRQFWKPDKCTYNTTIDNYICIKTIDLIKLIYQGNMGLINSLII